MTARQEGRTAEAWAKRDVSSSKTGADENFPTGSLLISPALRPVVHAYYRFARIADDVADTTELTPQEKRARLAALNGILEGTAQTPERADARSAATLRQALLEVGVPLSVATDLLVAFREDTEKDRYETWDELLHYCRYSANPVGRFLLALHREGRATFPLSDALCTALQVINHLQDVSGDLRRLNRCYVPQLWLEQEGVKTEDLALGCSKPGVRRVMNRMLDHVEELNRQARRLPGLIADRRLRLEAAVVVALCCRLTARLRRQDPLAERVALSRGDGLRALAWALRFWNVPA
ncbi:squalene synthase HpnC [Oecophyllibacter saccharovorans]|uniref:Squalene synthase HpnC n=1 Tax=Oecophyllibacter saccharovorans TaxID=2558360 RepID=A0A506US01_9PROT|nr:squalene synthase HpnC [Oecophyllibacter saccharovorans]TPW36127.1 squalene synthase HpnC [Oecophyllibacter saccharovorans]